MGLVGWVWWSAACVSAPVPVAGELAAATVQVGSPQTEACRATGEGQREVDVPALQVDVHEVTQERFAALRGYAPSFRRDCPTCPVDSVRHDEAEAFCEARSAEEGLGSCYACEGEGAAVRCEPLPGSCVGYRLPTEAEHEAASRAGATGGTPAGEITRCMATDPVADRIGWYKANSGGYSQPVGGKQANGAGLHDLAGNVAEWAASVADDGTAAVRGGSWYHNAEHLRSAARLVAPADARLSWVGFRCVRSR